MPNNVKKMTINYSPNFDLVKRNKKKIKYLIFHYTGMKSEISAIKKLTNSNSNVSCHYFICNNGDIIRLLPDLYTAWHAGVSAWKKDKFLNKFSIGIELSNPGHQHGYRKFSNKQINSLVKISRILIKKYKIKKKYILGHSDIAPLRKKDPGEKFPWKNLSKKKIGVWHNVSSKTCKKNRLKKIEIQKNKFLIYLEKFGYNVKHKNNSDLKKIIMSFQRRFRPEIINNFFDLECLNIIKSLNLNK